MGFIGIDSFISEPGYIGTILQRNYSKTRLKRPLKKKTKNCFSRPIIMLQGEHSVILSTFIKLPFVIKIFVLSIFEWLLRHFLLYRKMTFHGYFPVIPL